MTYTVPMGDTKRGRERKGNGKRTQVEESLIERAVERHESEVEPGEYDSADEAELEPDEYVALEEAGDVEA
jgi:hypothetical protein